LIVLAFVLPAIGFIIYLQIKKRRNRIRRGEIFDKADNEAIIDQPGDKRQVDFSKVAGSKEMVRARGMHEEVNFLKEERDKVKLKGSNKSLLDKSLTDKDLASTSNIMNKSNFEAIPEESKQEGSDSS